MAGWHGQAEPAPRCGTSSTGLHRVARAGPAELTGRAAAGRRHNSTPTALTSGSRTRITPSFRCRTYDLPAERGSDSGCGGAEVPGWFDEAPLVECRAVGDGAPVAETGEVKRPDVHDRLEPAEFVVGRLDMP